MKAEYKKQIIQVMQMTNNRKIYIVKIRYQWRVLPHDYSLYSTVYNFYIHASKKEILKKVMR